MVHIRTEHADDHEAVRALLEAAFPGESVGGLVDRLRGSPGYVPAMALVAEEGDEDAGAEGGEEGDDGAGEVVGYVLLSHAEVEQDPPGARLGGAAADDAPSPRTHTVAVLSPLATRPDRQGRGIARALVDAALATARARGEAMVVLEGNPALYARFGFVAAADLALRRPSERIPERAFQVVVLDDDAVASMLPGRLVYPRAFWDTGSVGLPPTDEAAVQWLDVIDAYARAVESAVMAGARAGSADSPEQALATPVPACPGWTVGEVLRHLGVIHRLIPAWVEQGRRPQDITHAPPDGDVLRWFASGWRAMHAALEARPADTPAATWSPSDASIGFWRRRMAHELAVHAADVLDALGREWWVEERVAQDGVDEVMHLWLGTRLADRADGGCVVRVVSGGVAWTVGLHGRIAEAHQIPADADAEVSGSAAGVYAWLWGRTGHGEVSLAGDPAAVGALRAALAYAMR